MKFAVIHESLVACMLHIFLFVAGSKVLFTPHRSLAREVW